MLKYLICPVFVTVHTVPWTRPSFFTIFRVTEYSAVAEAPIVMMGREHKGKRIFRITISVTLDKNCMIGLSILNNFIANLLVGDHMLLFMGWEKSIE